MPYGSYRHTRHRGWGGPAPPAQLGVGLTPAVALSTSASRPAGPACPAPPARSGACRSAPFWSRRSIGRPDQGLGRVGLAVGVAPGGTEPPAVTFMTATFHGGRPSVMVQQRLAVLSRRGVGFGVMTIERRNPSVSRCFLAVFGCFRPVCAKNANGRGRGRQWRHHDERQGNRCRAGFARQGGPNDAAP